MPGSTITGLLETLSSRPPASLPVVQCLHEASAVSVAHGYTKAAGRPAAVLLHSSVGFLNAAMAIYNAAVDLAPLILLIGTAPQMRKHKRPWIDHIHAGDEFAPLAAHLVKHISVAGDLDKTLEEVERAVRIASHAPTGPVAIFFDREALEEPVHDAKTVALLSRRENDTQPRSDTLSAVRDALASADHPVMLAGRLGLNGWDERVALADAANLAVLTDLRLPGAFPTSHPSYAGGLDLQGRTFGAASAVLRSADTVLALDWADPRGVSERAGWTSQPPETLFDVGVASSITAPLAARPEGFPFDCCCVRVQGQKLVSMLVEGMPRTPSAPRTAAPQTGPEPHEFTGDLSLPAVADLLREALRGRCTTLVKVPVEWRGHWWEIDDPQAYLGYDGGAGLGSGPGLLVGAALGLNTDRLAVAVLGDGDLLMGIQALWSIARAAAPALLVVIDNQGFANEAHHFEKIARRRGRPDSWQSEAFPFRSHPINLTGTVRDLGIAAFGPALDVATSRECLAQSLNQIDSGQPAVAHLKVKC